MRSAAQFLAAVPGCLAACQEELGDLQPGRVPVRVAPRWLPRIRSGEFAAITLPWAVYVSPGLLERSPEEVAGVLTHELVHVAQWRRDGLVRFALGYVGQYLGNRRRGMDRHTAYLEIPHEREARERQGRISGASGAQ